MPVSTCTHRIQLRARRSRRRAPGRDLGQAVQHRRQAMGEQRRHRIGRRAVQHKDARLRHQLAQRHAFFQPRHKKGVAAGAAPAPAPRAAAPRP